MRLSLTCSTWSNQVKFTGSSGLVSTSDGAEPCYNDLPCEDSPTEAQAKRLFYGKEEHNRLKLVVSGDLYALGTYGYAISQAPNGIYYETKGRKLAEQPCETQNFGL